VVAKVTEGLSVSKRIAQEFDMEKFNVRKLNGVDVKNSIRLKSQIDLHLWKT
jgi:hypothetical protein